MATTRFVTRLSLSLLVLAAISHLQAQTWSFAGNMNIARVLPTVTLLNNGEVLVTGGSAGQGAFSSAELYNPSTGTFSYTGSMNTGRAYHAAALLPSGEVLIVGGETLFPTNCLSSAELYNPSTGTFSYTGSLSAGYCGATATLLNTGKVLVANGTNAELYDPSSGTFSVTGSFKVSRMGPTTTLLGNGKVLFTGGFEGTTDYLKSAELYDPSTGTFALTGSMQTSRIYHTATLMSNGEVLIAGGETYITSCPCSSPLTAAELYNPATGRFTVTGNMNAFRYLHVAALLPSGKVLVAAGMATKTAELYDPSSGSFSYTGSLTDERDEGARAVSLDSGAVLVTGGEWVYRVYRTHFWNTAEIYQ